MKRVLSFLAVLCLLTTFLPAAVTAETYENFTYSVSGGKVTITDCAETATGEVVIPNEIGGYPVTTVATDAFADCAGVTAITIGANVTSVATGAFSGCSALATITVAAGNSVYRSAGNCLIETSSKILVAGCKGSVIPADGSVTAIGNMAFYKCDSLTAIEIPATVVSIGASAFEGCTKMTDITIGSNVTNIGNSAFFGCTALTAVEIPDSVATMGVYVFSGCSALTDVTIGDKLTVIGNAVFSDCTALTNVNLGESLVTIDIFAFSGCSKLDKVVLSNSVETIGKFAFYNCEGLTSVRIPESVKTIGNNAFAGCDALRLAIHEENTFAISYALNNGIRYTTIGVGSLAVTTVTLKPGVTGVYFKNNLDWAEGDTSILSYGIAVSTENAEPVADDSDASSRYTCGTDSVLIKDILKLENEVKENSRNARMTIYARAYIQLSNGTYIYSDTVQANLQQVVAAAQNKWEKLTEAQKDALKQMYTTYADVMAAWDVPNLKEA